MASRRGLMQALKESGTSKVVRYLAADQTVPSVEKAVLVYGSEVPKARSSFNVPRVVKCGNRCAHFAFTVPEKRENYRVLMQSDRALEELALCRDDELKEYCQGSKLYVDEERQIFPYALAYAGFQFGQFAGQLGDGRVANLFDIKDRNGNYQTLQIKGSGLTPFSRFADGKAILSASIREYVISETLNAVGIPSTRAVQLTLLPGTKARRTIYEPCASVTRFSPSWIRIGNFDLFRWRGDDNGMLRLADFCINEVFDGGRMFPKELPIDAFVEDLFPDPEEKNQAPVEPTSNHSEGLNGSSTVYEHFYRHVVNLNAECVAYWQAYGFCNGVLNTDNVSIMGLSMDFGPFAFMDKFKPNYTPNHDDIERRYAYANQPQVMWWNLTKLGEALILLLGAGSKHIEAIKALKSRAELTDSVVEDISARASAVIRNAGNEFKFRFTLKYVELMAKRLGIEMEFPEMKTENLDIITEKASDFIERVLKPFLSILQETEVDYNNSFVSLQNYKGPFVDEANGIEGLDEEFVAIFFNEKQRESLKNNKRIGVDDGGESVKLFETLESLKKWTLVYYTLVQDYSARLDIQRAVNPLFLPRNYIFDEVIDKLSDQREAISDPNSELDISALEKLFHISTNPYEASLWPQVLEDSTIERWTEGTTNMNDGDCMTQCGCSS
ncbi:HER114Cp [Eremothecium sinecaudum]|uniref:Selenoprotein O n=1 Tax=Eremothecium sinecaudum TaxID=45286 RepID=A0A109UZV2_9SACH|nr:HER114Cp [Eremothecium sinecaudum]AMD21393.1 HER114Cp [Eremothecium sinecaudum]